MYNYYNGYALDEPYCGYNLSDSDILLLDLAIFYIENNNSTSRVLCK